MAKALIYRTAPDGSIWRAGGGTSRIFYNVDTGKELSRRQWDKAYGSLKRRGVTSYERGALLTEPALRASRPAFNRPASSSGGVGKLRRLQPLTERAGRDISVPFYGFYDTPLSFREDVEHYRETYEQAMQDARHNKKILALQFVVNGFNEEGKLFHNTFQRLTEVDIVFDRLLDLMLPHLYKGDQTTDLTIHVRFRHEFIPSSKRKKEVAELRRLKVQRQKNKKRTRK